MVKTDRYGLVLLGGENDLKCPLDRGFPHNEVQKKLWQKRVPLYRQEIQNYAEIHGITAFYTLLGHGSVNQIKSMETLTEDLQPLIDSLNSTHGRRKWGILYGGDPANDKKPDIGAVAKLFSEKGARVVAVQCLQYASYMIGKSSVEGDKHPPLTWDWLDAAIVYKTEKKKDGSILFGGFDTTNPLHHLVGATRYIITLFGPSSGSSPQDQLLQGEIICGGGPISIHEHNEFFRRGYPFFYMPTEAKVRVVDSDLRSGESQINKYGIMHSWFADTGIPARLWAVLDQGTDSEGNDKNLVPWVTSEKEHIGPLDVNEHDKYKLPIKLKEEITKAEDPDGWWPRGRKPCRVVILQESIQKEIHIAFKIKRVFDIQEKENIFGLHFEFSALMECPVLTELEQRMLEMEQEGSPARQETNALLKQLVQKNSNGSVGDEEQLGGFGFDEKSGSIQEVNRASRHRRSVRRLQGMGSAAGDDTQKPKWDIYIPELEFVNAANIRFNGEDGWHSDSLNKYFR